MMLIVMLLQCAVGSSSDTPGGDTCVTWCQQANADSRGSGVEGRRCEGASWQQLTRGDKWIEGAGTGRRSLEDDREGVCWSGGSWQQSRGAVTGGSWQKAPTGGSGSSSASSGGSNMCSSSFNLPLRLDHQRRCGSCCCLLRGNGGVSSRRSEGSAGRVLAVADGRIEAGGDSSRGLGGGWTAALGGSIKGAARGCSQSSREAGREGCSQCSRGA